MPVIIIIIIIMTNERGVFRVLTNNRPVLYLPIMFHIEHTNRGA